MGDHSLHLQQSERLLYALQSASTATARGSVLTLALISFEHENEHVHDEEVKMGADAIICDCLVRAVAVDVESRQISGLCRLLENVYKCSDVVASASYCRHGALLLPLLVKIASSSSCSLQTKMIVTRLLQRNYQEGLAISQMKDADLLLIAMVRFLRSGMVDYQHHAIIALCSIGEHPESKAILARFPGFIEALIQSAETCEVKSLTLLASLALDSRNTEIIVKSRGFFTMLRISSSSKQPEILCKTCQCMLRISASNSAKNAFVNFESGELVDRLVDFLKQGNYKLKSIALRTISILVSDSTADVIGNIQSLLECLGDEASSIPASDCSILASKAIKRLSCYIRTRHVGHQALFDSLVRMARSPSAEVLLWAARAFIEHSLSASNSFIIVRCESTIDAILRLTKSAHEKVRSAAIEAIANLLQDAANARRILMHKSVLSTLVACIDGAHKFEVSENERREAVRAILLLVNHSSSMRRVARHSGLISALSRYGTSDDGDVELKRAALYGVLMLAPVM